MRCTPRRRYPTAWNPRSRCSSPEWRPVGEALDGLTAEQIAEVTTTHPRTGFTDGILHAFHAGMKNRPETTFGTINEYVLA